MSGSAVLSVPPDGLLPHPDVHPLVPDCDPVLAVLLDICGRLPRQGGTGHNHRPHHDHPEFRNSSVSPQGRRPYLHTYNFISYWV